MAKATPRLSADLFDATKPFYAAVGAGDLALEKARGIVSDVQDRVGDADPKEAQARIEAQLRELQAELKALPGKVEAQLRDLQAELKALSAKVETKYNEYVAKANDVAKEQLETVTTFAERGETVVARLRGQEVRSAAPAKKAAAPKAPATKSTAKSAPATKAGTKKAPIQKSTETA
jgi:heparin binding hemagglutinin HbhA